MPYTVSSALVTMIISIPALLQYNHKTSTPVGGFILRFWRIILEFVMIAVWSASFITMLLPKGKDYRKLFNSPPYAEWDVAAVIASFQMYVPRKPTWSYSMRL